MIFVNSLDDVLRMVDRAFGSVWIRKGTKRLYFILPGLLYPVKLFDRGNGNGNRDDIQRIDILVEGSMSGRNTATLNSSFSKGIKKICRDQKGWHGAGYVQDLLGCEAVVNTESKSQLF